MSQAELSASGVEKCLSAEDVIVSKTDLRGHITYANRKFIEFSEYSEEELLGAPHSIVRHPDMPRAIFKLIWDTISSGQETFAYVVNRTKHGNFYWVFAHISPTFEHQSGKIIAYHSSRRWVNRTKLQQIIPLYEELLRIERRYTNPKEQVNASFTALQRMLRQQQMSYDEFICSL